MHVDYLLHSKYSIANGDLDPQIALTAVIQS